MPGLYFLIQHDRHGYEPTIITPFEDPKEARKKLSALDRHQLSIPGAVTLESPPLRKENLIIHTTSDETLKEMYPRFFWNPPEAIWLSAEELSTDFDPESANDVFAAMAKDETGRQPMARTATSSATTG